MNILEEFDRCFMTLEGYMGTEKTNHFLNHEYGDMTQTAWREMLRAHNELLSNESRLYRTFWYIGVHDPHEMVNITLKLFYLRFHAARLP